MADVCQVEGGWPCHWAHDASFILVPITLSGAGRGDVVCEHWSVCMQTFSFHLRATYMAPA